MTETILHKQGPDHLSFKLTANPAEIAMAYEPQNDTQLQTVEYVVPLEEVVEVIRQDEGLKVIINEINNLEGQVPQVIIDKFRDHDQVVRNRLAEAEALIEIVTVQADRIQNEGEVRTKQRTLDATELFKQRQAEIKRAEQEAVARIYASSDRVSHIEHLRMTRILERTQEMSNATVYLFDSSRTAVSDTLRALHDDLLLQDQHEKRREAEFELVEMLDVRRCQLPGLIQKSKEELAHLDELLDAGEEKKSELLTELLRLDGAETAERLRVSEDEIRAIETTYVNNSELPSIGLEMGKRNILASAESRSTDLTEILFEIDITKGKFAQNNRSLKDDEQSFHALRLTITNLEQESDAMPGLIKESILRLVQEFGIPLGELEQGSQYLHSVADSLHGIMQGKLSKPGNLKMPRTVQATYEAMIRLQTIGIDPLNVELEPWQAPQFDDIELGLSTEPLEGDEELIKRHERAKKISSVVHAISETREALDVRKLFVAARRGLFNQGVQIVVSDDEAIEK